MADINLYMPISQLALMNNKQFAKITTNKAIDVHFLGINNYDWSNFDDKMILSIDNGKFVLNEDDQSIIISNDNKTLTTEIRYFIDNYSKIRLELDDLCTAGENGLALSQTLTMSTDSHNTNVQAIVNKNIHIYIETFASSYFESGENRYSFVNSINNLSGDKFKKESDYTSYTDSNLYDAEKIRVNDTNMCWAASTANMLAYTSWGQLGLSISASDTVEDEIMLEFIKNSDDLGFSPYYALRWFFSGQKEEVDPEEVYPLTGSGNYLKYSNTDTSFLAYFDTYDLREAVPYLLSGDAISLSIDTDDAPAHAITLWGIEFNKNYSMDDNLCITCIYFTDSDDYYSSYFPGTDATKAPDCLVYRELTWDATNKRYTFENFNNKTYYISSFTVLYPKRDEKNLITDNKTNIFVKAKDTITSKTILNNQRQIVQAEGKILDCEITGGESYIFVGGQSFNTSVKSGTQYINGSATNTSVYSSAQVYIYNKGTANNTIIYSGGEEIVSSGGLDQNATIYGLQYVQESGEAFEAQVYGRQEIKGYGYSSVVSDGGIVNLNAGITSNIIVNSGGTLNIWAGQDTKSIVSGGIINVYGKTKATTIENSGTLNISSGGIASDVKVNENGLHNIFDRGQDYNAQIWGRQVIYKGAKVYSAQVLNTGSQIVSGVISKSIIKGNGVVKVVNGGKSFATTVSAGQEIIENNGVASSAYVDGEQRILSGGKAIGTNVVGSGTLIVENLGTAVSPDVHANCIISSGGLVNGGQIYGSINIKSGGRAQYIEVYDGASLSVANGGIVSSIEVGYFVEAKCVAKFNNSVLYGSNTFQGSSIISGGTAKAPVSLAKNASLTFADCTNVSKLHLAVQDGQLNLGLRYQTNSVESGRFALNSIALKKNSKITYTIHSVNSKTPILKVSAKNTNNLGDFSIIIDRSKLYVAKEILSTNIIQKKNKLYTLYNKNGKLGKVKLNGTGLLVNNFMYHVISDKNNILLSSTKFGAIKKGNNSNNTLTGSTNNDIFYGAKGNDVLKGKNGRDVAIYDKNNWGKDIISKTSGTVTLLFNGLKATDLIKKTNGQNLIITRKSDKNQKITVQGWNSTTHNIVYGSSINAFAKYLKSSQPTSAQITAARNEIWKKSALAQA